MNLSTPDHLAITDHLLTTTRSVRKRLDLERPVEPEIIRQCIEIAIQAPTGSNRQGWHFVVVADAAKRAALAEMYRQAFDKYLRRGEPGPVALTSETQREGTTSVSQSRRVTGSALYLNKHLHRVPLFVIPCIEGRVEEEGVFAQASHYGSILPAVWSFMLALRARGLGSTWTTLHLAHEAEAAALLGIPETMTQTALLPVAYFKGDDFKPAKRLNMGDGIHWDAW